jgi:hypothetical protein
MAPRIKTKESTKRTRTCSAYREIIAGIAPGALRTSFHRGGRTWKTWHYRTTDDMEDAAAWMVNLCKAIAEQYPQLVDELVV